MDAWDSFEASMLERITPSREASEELDAKASELMGIVRRYFEGLGIDAEPVFAGSYAKGTYLNDPDFDLFIRFPESMPWADMERIGLQAGTDILHGEKAFAEHPYISGVFKGIEVDMVPCYLLKDTSDLKTSVDRTPFHTAFVMSRMDDGAKGQTRLLKRFMKGIGAYGAEPDVRGFSGYLCELLVIKFGTFRNVLKAAAGWREGTTFDIDGRGPKMKSALVVYDPVDNDRNVASAVHVDTLGRLVQAARRYLDRPDERFFFPNRRIPLGREEIRALLEKRGTRLVSVTLERPERLDDDVNAQLWRSRYALAKRLEEHGFHVMRAFHSSSGDRLLVAFELETDSLSKTVRHQGPPAWVADGNGFLEKWRGNPYGEPFLEDGKWFVIRERQYPSAKGMLLGERGMSGIGRTIDTGSLEAMDHDETIETADALALTELLLPMMPWDRP